MGRTSDARSRLLQATIDLIWLESYGTVTVDAICERAQVKKGSFYHFFKSKDDLVLAALDAHWEARRPALDRYFSATTPPIQRFEEYFAGVLSRQLELKKKYGRFVGCFYAAVGIGCCPEQSPAISKKVRTILGNYERYYETTLRDAVASGELRIPNVSLKAKALFAYMEGVLSQARLQNDPGVLRNLANGAFAFLGRGMGRTATLPVH